MQGKLKLGTDAEIQNRIGYSIMRLVHIEFLL